MHCYNKNDINILHLPSCHYQPNIKNTCSSHIFHKIPKEMPYWYFFLYNWSLLFMIFFFQFKSGFFFLSIFMIKYTQGKNHSLLQKLKENCQINFIVPLSYKASSKLMAHNSTTNEKRRKAIFKSVIKSQ